MNPPRRAWTANTRRRNWIVIGVVLVMLIAIRLVSSEPMAPLPYFAGPRPYVIAHQGGDHERPGNTLVALRHAEAIGADVLEMDVHATRDGVVVLMHDASVDRTTDGEGLIREMDLAEVEQLDAAYDWPYTDAPPRYRGRGVTVPTLDEVLATFPDVRFNIEIKQTDPPIAAAVCALLEKHRAVERTLVASFHHDAMVAFRRACPDVATSAARKEVAWFLLYHHLNLMGLYQPTAHALQVPLAYRGFELVNAEIIRDAARAGMVVDAWTVNDPEQLEALFALGIGGVITDVPARALEIRRRLRADPRTPPPVPPRDREG